MKRRLLLLSTLVSLLGIGPAFAADGAGSTRLLRQPTVSASHIAFAYANNIWSVERSGGLARRLTSFQGQTANPRFSPDGKWIAFSAEYAGNMDVYVIPAEGGEPKRLTWHPGADTVQGWMPDGSAIVFASARASAAPSAAPRFWTVPAMGGVETPMALPRAYQGRVSADGSKIAYRLNPSWDDERRNYRGGQNKPDLDRRYEDVGPRNPAMDRFQGHRARLGGEVGLLPLRSRWCVERVVVRHRGEEAHAGHEVHRLRRQDHGRPRRGRGVRAGGLHP
jgi:hypothetical protein